MSENEGDWYADEGEGEYADPEFVYQCAYCGNYVSIRKVYTGFRILRELPGDRILVTAETFCSEGCTDRGTRAVTIGR